MGLDLGLGPAGLGRQLQLRLGLALQMIWGLGWSLR